jgi:DNA-binding IclR family transcriptional regulator
MRSELALIRKRGYAQDLEENEAGVRCVAAAMADPLRGTISAISVSGPRDRITDERLREIAELVKAAVRSFTLHNSEDRE